MTGFFEFFTGTEVEFRKRLYMVDMPAVFTIIFPGHAG
jgi:hypothetical protein